MSGFDNLGDLLGKIVADQLQPIIRNVEMLKSNSARMIKEGTVEEIDATKGYRVLLGETDGQKYLSGWLPHPETGKTSVPLKKGQRVALLSPGGDLRQALLLRSGYSDDHKSPSTDMEANVFEDAGVKITIAGGALVVAIGGTTATLSASGLVLNASGTSYSFTGAGFAQEGGMQTHDGKDVGLTSTHTGVTVGGGTTGPVA